MGKEQILALPPLPSYLAKLNGAEFYDGFQMHQYAMKYAEAAIASYKAELLKEVGEPVLYAEFAEDGGWLGDASECADHLEEPHALYTSDQVAAAVLKETKLLEEEIDLLKAQRAYISQERNAYQEGQDRACEERDELRAQLAAAQEEIARLKEIEQTNDTLLDQLGDKNAVLLDQLATAEQRVAEACAKLYLEDYDLTDIADRVRSGEYRKFMKEV